MGKYLVDIKNERLSFFTPAGEVKALNDVTIHLEEGEVLGIVGESGSGKSVTAYSLMGLTAHPGKLLGGELEFNGHHVENMTEKEMRKIRGNEISIIFQDPMTSLNPVYTVGNQIEEVIRVVHQLPDGLAVKHAKAGLPQILQFVQVSRMGKQQLRGLYGAGQRRGEHGVYLRVGKAVFQLLQPGAALVAQGQVGAAAQVQAGKVALGQAVADEMQFVGFHSGRSPFGQKRRQTQAMNRM